MTVFVTAVTFFLAITVAKINDDISFDKELKVSEKLKKADERISINKMTTKVNEQKTAEALLKSDSLNNQLGLAQLQIEKAKLERDQLNLQTLDLEKKNLELSLKLRQEENKRTELINSLAPRALEQWDFSIYIKRYKNINVILECVDDEEAIHTLGQLNVIFNLANWKILSTKIIDVSPMIRDGVSIYRNVGSQPEDDQSDEAADALLTQLKLNEIDANIFPESEFPKNTIKIKIGRKPDTYIKKWITKQISIRRTKLDSIEILMKKFTIDKKSFLLNKYTLGFILFTIDEKRNIIPSTSELTQVLDFNWDNAGFQDLYMREDIFQLPKITHIETKEVLLHEFESVKIEEKHTLVKEIDAFGRFLFNSKIRMFFEVIEWNKFGVLCLIGYKN